MTAGRRAVAVVAVAVLVVALLAGTLARDGAPAADDRGRVLAVTAGEEQWAARLPAGTRVQRIVYRSRSGLTGAPTAVSGALFVPPGPPPSGGWPLIVNAHGTTGITADCAPSDTTHLYGATIAVDRYLRDGYAVIAPDYQGLGTRIGPSPPHPYLEPVTAGYNLIDAARAARRADARIGDRWLATGVSQGGAAVWAAAEQYPTYGAGSGRLLGAVATVPVLDPVDFVGRAQNGSLSHSQKYVYPILVAGVAQAGADIDVDEYLHGVVENALPRILSCSPDQWVAGTEIEAAPPGDFAADPADAAALERYLEGYRLPQRRTPVPLLVVYGTDDEIIATAAVQAALHRACRLGDTVTWTLITGGDHNLDAQPIAGPWMAARLAGEPAPSNC